MSVTDSDVEHTVAASGECRNQMALREMCGQCWRVASMELMWCKVIGWVEPVITAYTMTPSSH